MACGDAFQSFAMVVSKSGTFFHYVARRKDHIAPINLDKGRSSAKSNEVFALEEGVRTLMALSTDARHEAGLHLLLYAPADLCRVFYARVVRFFLKNESIVS